MTEYSEVSEIGHNSWARIYGDIHANKYYIDMKGAYTREEINRRVEAAEKAALYLGRRGDLDPQTVRQRIARLAKLRKADIGSRAISEARRHPDGMVNLTLHYGRDKAFGMRIDRMQRLRRLEKTRRAERMERMRKARFDRG